jgi:hypothetical protein
MAIVQADGPAVEVARAGPNRAAVTALPALVTGHLVGVLLDQEDGLTL